MKKPTFLERLTGAQTDEEDRILDDDRPFGEDDDLSVQEDEYEEPDEQWEDNSDTVAPQDGELPVDMYQTDDMIVIRALVPGVSPGELEISITRDMVTVRGAREEY